VSRLRTKLSLHPEHGFRLAAIYSVGYRLEAVAGSAGGAAEGDESAEALDPVEGDSPTV
jgi:hypothetical protein